MNPREGRMEMPLQCPVMDTARAEQRLERARAMILDAMPGLLAIYVFGSTAQGQATDDSDLDLAVLGNEPVPSTYLYDLARTMESQLGIDVDLVDLLTASTVLKKEVIAGGSPIHCDDRDAVLDFEARTLSEYGRYREGMEPLLQAVQDTGKAYEV